jgi:hypothetical protein
MHWESTYLKNGTWFWWAEFPEKWTAWVIDDSPKHGRGTQYRIAASVRTVTFFSHCRYLDFQEAKSAAVELQLSLKFCPLGGRSGHFAKKVTA